MGGIMGENWGSSFAGSASSLKWDASFHLVTGVKQATGVLGQVTRTEGMRLQEMVLWRLFAWMLFLTYPETHEQQ